MFINNTLTIEGDYRLSNTSPCINAGINSTYASDIDLNGNNRVNGIIDIGAFESLIELISKLKMKEGNSWIDISKVYKKINGTWVQ